MWKLSSAERVIASLNGFPLETPSVAALAILFPLAAISHDYWNANLGPLLWKSIHLMVYGAFALLVAHVALGALPSEPHPAYSFALAAAVAVLSSPHLTTALRAPGPVQRHGGAIVLIM